jgi:VWFA-related protein
MLRSALIGALVAAASWTAVAQQPSTPFTAGTSLVVVPVAVVDRKGQSLENLTVTDFEVREDGKPVAIQTFIPPQSISHGAESRFIVLALDNLRTPAELAWRVRSIAMRFVERMGPADTMTVIPINRGQGMTSSSKAELKAAIDRYRPAFGDTIRTFDQDASHSLRMIASLAEQSSTAPHRRRVIAVIGSVGTFNPQRRSAVSGDRDLAEDWFDAVRETARHNVSVYVIDPMGQGEGAYSGDHATSFSAETGGWAWANTNNFGGAVEQIWREAGSYYVLGYNAPVTDGKIHAIEVNVKVKGATVRARRGRG